MKAMHALLAASLTVMAMVPVAEAQVPRSLVSRLMPGLDQRVVLVAGTPLSDGTRYLPKNDLTAWFPGKAGTGILMVGHELRAGAEGGVGGAFSRLEVRRTRGKDGLDFVVTGGQRWAQGMHNNCAGGVTPWGTVLSGEEYPIRALPEADWAAIGKPPYAANSPIMAYGWIQEIVPGAKEPSARLKTRKAMGRFSHEAAAVADLRTVYMTEDDADGHLYRFTAKRPRDLSEGRLEALDVRGRRWITLADPGNASWEATRKGATLFQRLEDVQIGPDRAVWFAETGMPEKGDPYGRVHRLDPRTLELRTVVAGDGRRLANPDNLAFDRKGRLYICEDQNQENYDSYGDNQILRWNQQDGSLTEVLAIGGAAEPSGPSFLGEDDSLVFTVMAGRASQLVHVWGAPLR